MRLNEEEEEAILRAQVLVLMSPHTPSYVSSYYYMCPQTSVYVSLYQFICLILIYVCPQIKL
jgi:hypothetical protein